MFVIDSQKSIEFTPEVCAHVVSKRSLHFDVSNVSLGLWDILLDRVIPL